MSRYNTSLVVLGVLIMAFSVALFTLNSCSIEIKSDNPLTCSCMRNGSRITVFNGQVDFQGMGYTDFRRVLESGQDFWLCSQGDSRCSDFRCVLTAKAKAP